VKSSDAKFGEKLAAMLVTGAMKTKVKLGGGLNIKEKNNFNSKLKDVKKAIKKAKDVKQASKIAYVAAKKVMKGTKAKTPRVIPIAKRGGILPLIPAFAGLSALGALLGGASSIYKTVKEVHNARKSMNEMKRHNETMEAIAIGDKKKGSGFYVKPYKNGYGIYTKPKN
jgi:ribosomal protein S5